MTDIDEAPEPADGAFALAYGLGYDARLDELNRLYAEIAALNERLDAVRIAAVAYEEYPIDASDRPEAWGLLGRLVALAKIQSAGAGKS